MDIAGVENRPVKNITDKEAADLAHTIKIWNLILPVMEITVRHRL